MYSMVMMMAVAGSGDVASFGKHKGGCCGGEVVVSGCCGGGAKHGLFGMRSGGLFGKHKGGCCGGEVVAPPCCPEPIPVPAPCAEPCAMPMPGGTMTPPQITPDPKKMAPPITPDPKKTTPPVTGNS